VGAVYLAYAGPGGGSLDFSYLVYLPLIWIAVAGGFPRVVAAVVVANVLAVALVGRAVLSHPLRLQLGLVALTLAGLALGALITQRRADAAQADHAARHDPLTGLPNRVLLMDRLHTSIDRRRTPPGPGCAVLYCDLDGFKPINDQYGHAAGDGLLQSVADRIRRSMPTDAVISRLGGDEFVVLLPKADPADAAAAADTVLAQLSSEPFQVTEHEVALTVSIGVAVQDAQDDPGPGSGSLAAASISNAEEMLLAADTALRQAKLLGGNCAAVFDPVLRNRDRDRLALHAALHRAVTGKAISLVYQPVVALPAGSLVAVEALARWHDPTRGQAPPDEFIAAAEDTGLIHDLGLHLLEQACAQTARWRADRFPVGCVMVNVSARQLAAPGFAQQVRNTLHRHSLAPTDIGLEITESIAMSQNGPTRTTLDQLAAAGIALSLDDFGTGYSSFTMLHDLRLYGLKIDKSFIARLPADAATTAILQAILTMAGQLNLKVTAEGVETVAQLQLLAQLRCHQVQGYFLSRPLTAEQLQQRWTTGTRLPDSP